jgi:hypothetical protein
LTVGTRSGQSSEVDSKDGSLKGDPYLGVNEGPSLVADRELVDPSAGGSVRVKTVTWEV